MTLPSLALALVLTAGPAPVPEAAPKPVKGSRFAAGGNLTFEVPLEWEQIPTNSQLRRGQWRLPAIKGDKTPPEAVLFYFGPGQGGDAEANLERWFQGWDVGPGKAAKDVAKVTTVEKDGVKVTRVTLAGRYVAPKMPGKPETWNEPNWELFAAIIEHAEGPHFLRVVGPAKSIKAQQKALDRLVESFRTEKPQSRHAVPK